MNKEPHFYRKVLLGLSVFTFFVSIHFVSTTFAATTLFNRNLSIGTSGDDVSLLQTILSKDLASQGINLPNTGYFGNLTKNAVIAFQNKYAAQTLTPAGLTVGTGFVGSLTRAQLNIVQSVINDDTHLNSAQIEVVQQSTVQSSINNTTNALPEIVDPSKLDWSIFLKNGAKQSDIDTYKAYVIAAQKSSANYAAIQAEKQKNANTKVTLDTVIVDGSEVSAKNPILWTKNSEITVKGGGFSGKNTAVWSSGMGFVQTFTEKADQSLSFKVQNFSLGSSTRQIQQYYKQPTLSTYIWVETDDAMSKKIVIPVVFDVQ